MLIGSLVGNPRQIRLGSFVRVAKTPPNHRLAAKALAALRLLAGEAGAALTSGRDGSDEHAVADLVTGDARAEFFDDAHRLMADD